MSITSTNTTTKRKRVIIDSSESTTTTVTVSEQLKGDDETNNDKDSLNLMKQLHQKLNLQRQKLNQRISLKELDLICFVNDVD